MGDRTPTTTANALLGLLAVRPMTAYELTGQMRRALRWAWPRSEANLYSEAKRLVSLGLARAVAEEAGGRTRTRYVLTDVGREAVAGWLRSPPQPPTLQFEALLRVFLADLGDVDDLRSVVVDTRRQVADGMAEAMPVLEDYAGGAAPFPGRAHLNVLFIHFMAGFFRHVLTWCDEVDAELDAWPSTADVGITPGTRRMVDEALAFYRTTVAGQPAGEEGP